MILEKTIENAVFNLCKDANLILSDGVFTKIKAAYNNESEVLPKQALELILNNAKVAYEKNLPLCQDTGVVIVFVKIGEKVAVENFKKAINSGVEKAYKNCFFRKSIVKNAIFNRENTKTNLPLIIYPEIVNDDKLELEILVKGGGAENMSRILMLSPTSGEADVIQFVVDSIKSAGAKPCPPLFLGIGIGGTMEYAGILSKKALCLESDVDENHKNLAEKIKSEVNSLKIGAAGMGGENTVLDVKILTDFAHIASMPVALSINCHSNRHAKCLITKDNEVKYFKQNEVKNYTKKQFQNKGFKQINTSEIEAIKKLKKGDKILLSGDLYTARDAAHKRLKEMIKNGETLPFELKNSIIFYAGPTPELPNSISGSIGPTTSSRMDKFAPLLYDKGVLATIGKGERNDEVKSALKRNNAIYFTTIGGIAAFLAGKVTEKSLIAFDDLGTEAIYKITVKDFPLYVN